MIGPINFPDTLHVCVHMREWDRREVYATRFDDSPLSLAREVVSVGRFGWIAYVDDAPAVVLGANPLWPGVWNVFMLATDDFHKVRFSLVRHVRRVMFPALVAVGAHRAQCFSLEGHEDAHAWMVLLGAKPGEPIPEYGRDRETFVPFVWTRPDVLRQRPRGQERRDRA